MQEQWKNVFGYENLYQVSNMGRVKSLKYNKERILKPRKNQYRYLQVHLCKDGKVKQYQVHRLVASAFIPNDNLFNTQVNHIDEDKENNRVENLEWCSADYNNNYGTRNQRTSKALTNHPNKSKSVNQYTLDGEYIKSWKSAREIERKLGYSQSCISKCCLGKYNTAYKYKWSYA